MSKNMKKTKYLYNLDPKSFKGKKYKKVLKMRIKGAKNLINILYTVNYRTRNTDRIKDCVNAIKFNEELLKELKE